MPGPAPFSKKLPDTTDNIEVPKGCPPKVKPYFKQIVEELQRLKLASNTDSSIVYSLAVQMFRRQQLIKNIVEHGETFVTPDGLIKINPSAKLLNDVVASILRLSMQLGLDPKSRKSITGDSEFEEEPEDINDMLEKMM